MNDELNEAVNEIFLDIDEGCDLDDARMRLLYAIETYSA